MYEHVPFLLDFVPHGRKCGAGVCAGREMDSQREREGERGGRQRRRSRRGKKEKEEGKHGAERGECATEKRR